MNVKSFSRPFLHVYFGILCKKMEFYGRRNTFSGGRIHMSIRLFAQTLLRVLPLIYAATQKNIHIRRGEQEEIFNELF